MKLTKMLATAGLVVATIGIGTAADAYPRDHGYGHHYRGSYYHGGYRNYYGGYGRHYGWRHHYYRHGPHRYRYYR